jgi:hypothetical protein
MVGIATMAPKNKKAMESIFRSVHGLAKNYFFCQLPPKRWADRCAKIIKAKPESIKIGAAHHLLTLSKVKH